MEFKFKTEDHLYEVAARFWEKHISKLANHPNADWLFTDNEMVIREIGHKSARVHFVGEHHISREPTDYIHAHIVPQIEQEPQNWLLLAEDAIHVSRPLNDPGRFYLQELARLFRLPYDEALSSLFAANTREYIKEKSSLSDDDFYRLLITFMLGDLGPKDQKFFERRIWLVSQDLKKPLSYIQQLMRIGPYTGFEDLIGKYWNEFSKIRFHKILEKYADKKEVLVNAGYNHLPAFL